MKSSIAQKIFHSLVKKKNNSFEMTNDEYIFEIQICVLLLKRHVS